MNRLRELQDRAEHILRYGKHGRVQVIRRIVEQTWNAGREEMVRELAMMDPAERVLLLSTARHPSRPALAGLGWEVVGEIPPDEIIIQATADAAREIARIVSRHGVPTHGADGLPLDEVNSQASPAGKYREFDLTGLPLDDDGSEPAVTRVINFTGTPGELASLKRVLAEHGVRVLSEEVRGSRAAPGLPLADDDSEPHADAAGQLAAYQHSLDVMLGNGPAADDAGGGTDDIPVNIFTVLERGPATPEEIAVQTGDDLHLVQVILREAGDRDWCEKLPDGRWALA